MENKRKLSSLLINPSFQGKFLLMFGGFMLLQTFFFFYTLNLVFSELTALVNTKSLGKADIVLQVNEMQGQIFLLFGGVFVLLTLVFLIVGFRFTHKTAGAVFHFKKTFDDIESSGELKDIHLRKGDFFMEVQDSFNRMILKVKGK